MESTQKHPSIFGGALLVVGSCVGAGMLGLPIMTGLAGFYPSFLIFFLGAIFMTCTAFLLVEVQQEFDHPVNLSTMCGFSLGKITRFICSITYLFLFYALLVAYTTLSGHHTALIVQQLFQIPFPQWAASLFFVTIFGMVVYRGTRPVDLLNRGFMVFKIMSYAALIFVGSQYVDTTLYDRVAWVYLLPAIPIVIISFGFHNMVPSLVKYYKSDVRKVWQAILYGAIATLVINLLWQIIALGTIPFFGDNGLLSSFEKGVDAAQSMTLVLQTPAIQIFSTALAFFAIMTSFLAQSLSLVHFLQDMTKVKSHGENESGPLTFLALVPPLVIAILGPNLFFSALNFAGGICATFLFGLLPVLMCWRKRYHRNHTTGFMVFGGKPLLIGLFLFALFVMIYQLCSMMGVV